MLIGLDDRGISVRLNQLGMRFTSGQPVLAEIDWTVPSGGFSALVGPSGCGKSTLLRLVARLLEPTSGSLSTDVETGDRSTPLEGSDDRAPPGCHSCPEPHGNSAITGRGLRVGFVFQQPNLLPWRDVVSNVLLPLELANHDRSAAVMAAKESCARVGLIASDLGKLPRMLSGGMQMRVSLARALVTRPTLLLMDEPFAAVDDQLRHQLNDDVLRLWAELRFTCILVTHHLPEAVYMAERVAVLSPSPGRFLREFSIPFPYPRSAELRASGTFAQMVGEIDTLLRRGSP